jgi:hypothetical protein
MMIDRILIVLLSLSLLVVAGLGGSCDATVMTWASNYSLGKQDEFNQTLAKLQTFVGRDIDITYSYSGGIYFLNEVQFAFSYDDSHQKVTVQDDNVIFIEGGKINVAFNFSWDKMVWSDYRGNGTAIGVSNSLSYSKQLVIINGTAIFHLLKISPFTISEDAFTITSMNPELSDHDKANVLRMLNNLTTHYEVKNQLETEMQNQLASYLNAGLKAQVPIEPAFNYNWNSSKGAVTIPFTKRPVLVQLDKEGLTSSFDIQVADATNWICDDRSVPDAPYNGKYFFIQFRLYGKTQEFVSLGFY